MGCCLTSWFLKKQPALAISTTEAEYVSLEKACQQALWMKQALADYSLGNRHSIGVKQRGYRLKRPASSDEMKTGPIESGSVRSSEVERMVGEVWIDRVQAGHISVFDIERCLTVDDRKYVFCADITE
ncbi:hypothetical protein Tco_1342042 [Tanacetum coccineum]